MLVALSQRAVTYRELTEISGLTHERVATWLNALRAHGLLYISTWKRDSLDRSTIPAFAWGPGRSDAARGVVPADERMRAYRERKSHEMSVVQRDSRGHQCS